MRVLIADDSAVIVQRLVTMLADVDGLELVGHAGTVAEASQAVRTLTPDVVILDMQMPGGSGIDVLQSMKRDRVAPIVIVLTNYPYPQYRKKCMQSGARFFMDKSTEFERVGAVLHSLIRHASSGPEDRHDTPGRD